MISFSSGHDNAACGISRFWFSQSFQKTKPVTRSGQTCFTFMRLVCTLHGIIIVTADLHIQHYALQGLSRCVLFFRTICSLRKYHEQIVLRRLCKKSVLKYDVVKLEKTLYFWASFYTHYDRGLLLQLIALIPLKVSFTYL